MAMKATAARYAFLNAHSPNLVILQAMFRVGPLRL